MPVADVLVALIGAAVPIGITLFVLTHLQTVEADITQFSKNLIQAGISPIVNAWVEVTIIGAVMTGAIYAASKAVGHKTGEYVPLPQGPGFAIPAAPTFSSSTGYGGNLGPIAVSSGVGINAPSPSVSAPSRQVRRTAFPTRSSGPRVPRAVRRAANNATIAQANADAAQARYVQQHPEPRQTSFPSSGSRPRKRR